MLVLTRGVREGVQIGGDIVIGAERVEPGHIDLRVDAPSQLRRRLEPEGLSVPADHAVVSLRAQDTLCIGFNIRVLVIQIVGERVRLGIESPRETQIHRLDESDRAGRE